MIYERPKRTRGEDKREQKALKLLSMTQNYVEIEERTK